MSAWSQILQEHNSLLATEVSPQPPYFKNAVAIFSQQNALALGLCGTLLKQCFGEVPLPL